TPRSQHREGDPKSQRRGRGVGRPSARHTYCSTSRLGEVQAMMSEMRKATWSGLEGRLVVRSERRASVLPGETVEPKRVAGPDPDPAMPCACDPASVTTAPRR